MNRFVVSSVLLLWLGACSPSMDWRQIRPDGWAIEASLPCRPASHARTVTLAGEAVSMTVYACTVDGVTFGLASAALSDVRRVDAALIELADAASRNVSGAVDVEGGADVLGMTPTAAARRVRLHGRLPDGRAVVEHVAFFSFGPRVYQATLLGGSPSLPVVDAFFAGLKIRR